jgi:hypothetical protein
MTTAHLITLCACSASLFILCSLWGLRTLRKRHQSRNRRARGVYAVGQRAIKIERV